MKCPKCQTDNPVTVKFCGECGTNITSLEEAQPQFTKTLETPFPQLTKGTTLADRYEIQGELGKGGMGEVYLAEDTNLKRQVAIKVLPQQFALDQERLARFEREARLLASLNHPNIATIYGLEKSDDQQFLVMELIEGETLRDKISKEPLPADEAIEICSQIAEGLESAHEGGIIHRDLKPANIKVTPEGKVKILDFGIAKVFLDQSSESDPDKSPAITDEMTRPGMVLGTTAYMSPEQAKGKTVDRRTDIWSFGCILYECLTGARPFRGETISETVASILKDEPNWKDLPSDISLSIQRILSRCLIKDARNRMRDIGDVHLELTDQFGYNTIQPLYHKHSFYRQPLFYLAAFAAAFLIGSLGFWLGLRIGGKHTSLSESQGPLGFRGEINLPQETVFDFGGTNVSLLALSPDGMKLIYVGRSDSGRQLYLRRLDSFETIPIPGTQGALHPFFSPDSNWVGFLTSDAVKKVSLTGSGTMTLCGHKNAERACWTSDGWIYFGEKEATILSRISSEGGPAEKIADLNEIEFVSRFNEMLPDGKWALISTRPSGISSEYCKNYALSIETLERIHLFDGGYDVRYASPGYLVFARSDTIHAVSFDSARMKVSGDPIPIVLGVETESLFATMQATFSQDGKFAYCPGGDAAVGRIVRIDRKGKSVELDMPLRIYGVFDLSPDQSKLAVHVADFKDFISIYDLNSEEMRRLPAAEELGWPQWSPEGNSIAFRISSEFVSKIGIYDVGSGKFRDIVEDKTEVIPCWAPSGDLLMVSSFERGDIGFFDLQRDTEVQWFKTPNVQEYLSSFSPDGNWIAYTSDKTGRLEIWIRSFPDGEISHQISSSGGWEPIWLPSGELFYRLGSRFMSTQISTKPTVRWDSPQLVWEDADFVDTPGISYDVTPDGRYLYYIKSTRESNPNRIHVVHNWVEEIKRQSID
jgi:serine/threonine protein kinase